MGKSTIATQLAQRLNLPNVLQVHHYLQHTPLLPLESHGSRAGSLFLWILQFHSKFLTRLVLQTDMVYELLRTATE